jgi:hypothetical protein
MPKNYDYFDLKYPVADNEVATLSVEFISDGNSGATTVNNRGTLTTQMNVCAFNLGTGSELRDFYLICSSAFENAVPEVKTIKVNYRINGQLLQAHENSKTEEPQPEITLYITFPTK